MYQHHALFYAILGIKPRALYTLGKYSTNNMSYMLSPETKKLKFRFIHFMLSVSTWLAWVYVHHVHA